MPPCMGPTSFRMRKRLRLFWGRVQQWLATPTGRWLVRAARNPYVRAITFSAVWLLFFDRFDLRTQLQKATHVRHLEDEYRYYQKEIQRLRTELHKLKTDPEALAQVARETYRLHRPGEAIVVAVPQTED